MAELPPGARMTPLTGLAQRITQAARFVITGVQPTTWFGPSQPLAPMAPQEPEQGVKGRQFDYPTGINLNYQPRSSESISFWELRAIADSAEVLRIVIDSRKDQMSSLEWVIVPRQAPEGADASIWYKQGAKAHPEASDDTKARIKAVTQFFQYPDRQHSWDHWIREWMEDVFVIDAPAIQRRRNRDGTLYSLEVIDGATIKPLLAADGRSPLPPEPAYQQILHGVPAADFTSEELLYVPWNLRSNRIYGYSKVEQILITVNTMIRRSLFQLKYYTEGSQPDAFMGLPKEWNLQQIKDFQDWMDSLLSGNLNQRRKLRMVPGEFKYQETKTPPLKDIFDEYLARIICFTFAVAPDPFIEHVSRGAVEKSHTRALEEGLEPNQRYIKSVVDRIINEDFDSPDLEFRYVDNREQDPKAQMEIDVGYAKAGIYAIDEVRVARGKPALGGPASIPMLATPSGYVPLSTLTAPGSIDAIASSGGPAAQAIQHLSGRGDRNTDTNPNPNGSSARGRGRNKSNSDSDSEDLDVAAMIDIRDPEVSMSKSFRLTPRGSVIVSLAKGSGLIAAANAEEISIPVASEEVRDHIEHLAWRRVQEQSFRISNQTVPISLIWATQNEVDRVEVGRHAEEYKTAGYKMPPLVLPYRGKYYILDGHHRVEGAKVAGATSILVSVLQEDLDPDSVNSSNHPDSESSTNPDFGSNLHAIESALSSLSQGAS